MYIPSVGSSGSLARVYVVPGLLYGRLGHGTCRSIVNPSEGSMCTVTFSSTWSFSVLVQSNYIIKEIHQKYIHNNTKIYICNIMIFKI